MNYPDKLRQMFAILTAIAPDMPAGEMLDKVLELIDIAKRERKAPKGVKRTPKADKNGDPA